jgi:hypothetical protein
MHMVPSFINVKIKYFVVFFYTVKSYRKSLTQFGGPEVYIKYYN